MRDSERESTDGPQTEVSPHRPDLLGAIAVDGGTWFRVEAPNATRVDLCLFDSAQPVESLRLTLERRTDGSHERFVEGVRAGQLYGYRAFGPAGDGLGHAYNSKKLLVDPWARRVEGNTYFHPSQRTRNKQGHPDLTDSAVAGLRSVVVADVAPPSFARPSIPRAEMVLYECHVRGMTARHPSVPEAQRGTFTGFCHPAVIAHLKGLSVTTVSLLPVAVTYVEEHLVEKGLTNYWGYAPFAAFAPDPRFAMADGDPVSEFQNMVKALHAEGIEVVLDVVFNHTGEGNLDGSTLSFRGLDQAAFYALRDEPAGALRDYSGCGNSLDLSSPTCLRYVLDALRYWVTVMGADGFRFDLASALARDPVGFAPHGPFLSAIQQDPVLRTCKLIAEPWDLGDYGYRLGGFPACFSEWNDRYRDGVRRFFRGDEGSSAELATRLSGSSDLFASVGRGPAASVNFITSHDGFTLWDLVSYEHRHNAANGEQGRDGHGENISQNFGVEGPSTDATVLSGRLGAARAMLLCMAVSHGLPMLAHGDELGRTQFGNNNAYCQDGDLTYMDWSGSLASELLPFVQAALAVRGRHPCLRSPRHMHGDEREGRPDLSWWQPDGRPMDGPSWQQRAFSMCIHGALGDGVLLLINGGDVPCRFALPKADRRYLWGMVLSADEAHPHTGEEKRVVVVAPCSAALLEQRRRA